MNLKFEIAIKINFRVTRLGVLATWATFGRSMHGQTLANRMKPGPSLQVEKWLRLNYILMFLLSKTA